MFIARPAPRRHRTLIQTGLVVRYPMRIAVAAASDLPRLVPNTLAPLGTSLFDRSRADCLGHRRLEGRFRAGSPALRTITRNANCFTRASPFAHSDWPTRVGLPEQTPETPHPTTRRMNRSRTVRTPAAHPGFPPLFRALVVEPLTGCATVHSTPQLDSAVGQNAPNDDSG